MTAENSDSRSVEVRQTPELAQELEQAVDLLRQQQADLFQAGKSGANWLFWVAALSLVNSTITLFGGDTRFVVGLAVTTVADAVAKVTAEREPDIASVVMTVAIAFSLFVSGLFAGAGWLARKRFNFVFAFAMFVYLLDGALCLFFGDVMSAGFHAFALFCMWGGFNAFRKLRASEESVEMMRQYGVNV